VTIGRPTRDHELVVRPIAASAHGDAGHAAPVKALAGTDNARSLCG